MKMCSYFLTVVFILHRIHRLHCQLISNNEIDNRLFLSSCRENIQTLKIYNFRITDFKYKLINQVNKKLT